MKRLLLAAVLTALTLDSYALTVGTGNSYTVETLTGTVKQVGTSVHVHQGREVGLAIANDHANDNANGLAQAGTYKMKDTSTTTFKGTLESVTTTTKGFSFFE